MSARLDPRQLDSVWDALVLGKPFAVENWDDRLVLELLAEPTRITPRAAFVQSLEDLLQTPHVTPAISTTTNRTVTSHRTTGRVHPFACSRWLRGAAALAALTLIVAFSAIALTARLRSPHTPAIPAASELAGQGPSTSASVDIATFYEQTYSTESLSEYGVHQWNWVELTEGTLNPGEQPQTPLSGTGDAAAGFRLLTAIDGAIAIVSNTPAKLYSQSAPGEGITVEAGIVQLHPGDTLIYQDAGAIWNPSNTPTRFVEATLDSALPKFVAPQGAIRIGAGNSRIPPDFAAGTTTLDISMQRIVLDPGETFAYTSSPQMILVANTTGGFLEKQAWADGKAAGQALKMLAMTPYFLSNYGSGYFTLTNSGSNPVTVSLFTIAPPGNEYFLNPSASPVVDTPFGTWAPVLSSSPG